MGLVTLLRHAPLPKEYQKKYIGHSDIDIDISLIDELKLNILNKKDYDLIYSSDLKRCTQTLDLFNLPYTTNKNLREVKFKDEIEKKSFEQIEQLNSYDKKYLDNIYTWYNYICEESFDEFKNRINSFLNTLPKDKKILICSHKGTIRMIYSILKKEEFSSINLKVNYLEEIFIEK
ncbi:histidine phosphatase family protein [Campylobacterota bacterium DY0563]